MERRLGTPHPAPSPAGQLAGRFGRTIDHRCNFVERKVEHVVEHEGQALGRRERIEYDQQGEFDRVGEKGLVLGLSVVLSLHDRIGHVDGQRIFRAGRAGSQHVEGDPGDDRGEPSAQVVDPVNPRSAEPDPGVLHRIVGLGQRAQHPVRDRPKVRPVLLEAFGQPLLLVPVVAHVAHPVAVCGFRSYDTARDRDVTGVHREVSLKTPRGACRAFLERKPETCASVVPSYWG